MKRKYMDPELEVIILNEVNDIVTSSSNDIKGTPSDEGDVEPV